MSENFLKLWWAVRDAIDDYIRAEADDRAVAGLPADWAGDPAPPAPPAVPDVPPVAGVAPWGAAVIVPPPIPIPAGGVMPRVTPDPGPAPAPSPAQPDLADTAPELDAQGVAWDPTVHSENRTKTKDGCWRMKRGVKPADTTPPTPAPALAPVHSVPPAPPAPPAPSASAAAPEPGGPTPGQVAIGETVRALTAGQITRIQVEAALKALGLSTLGALTDQAPDMIDRFRAELARVSQ